MKNYIVLLLCFFVSVNHLRADDINYYTLQDDDVRIANGVLYYVNPILQERHIYIPDSLDNQRVTEINIANNNQSFGYALQSVKFSSSLRKIGTYSFISFELNTVDFSLCTSLEEIGTCAFYISSVSEFDLSSCFSLKKIAKFAFVESANVKLPFFDNDFKAEWRCGDGSILASSSEYSATKEYTSIVYYTLNEEDVELVNGELIACNLDYIFNRIIIPDEINNQPIVSISGTYEKGAFEDMSLIYVTLPSGLKEITRNAFANNTLDSLSFKDTRNIEIIGANAFYEAGLKYVDFANCDKLQEIGSGSFSGNSITTLNLNSCNSLVAIGSSAFSDNALVDLKLDSCVLLESIGAYAFSNNSLSSLNLSHLAALKTIGDLAFQSNNLTSVNFNNCTSLIKIEEQAFYRNRIKNLNLNPCINLRVVGAMAFGGSCYDEDVIKQCTKLHFIGESAFVNSQINTLIVFPELDYESFEGWFYKDLKMTKMYDNCEWVAKVFYTLGDEDVEMKEGLIQETVYDFEFKYIIIPQFLQGQEVLEVDNGFYKKDLRGIVFPKSLRKINKYTFENNKINYLDFSACESLVEIGREAFEVVDDYRADLSFCSELRFVGEDAFKSDEFSHHAMILPSVNYQNRGCWLAGNGQHFYDNDTVSGSVLSYVFVRPSSYTLKDEDVLIRDGEITKFYDNVKYRDVYIPDVLNGQQVSSIGNVTSYPTKYITSLSLPKHLKKIGANSLKANCIDSVDFSRCVNLELIGENAFSDNCLSRIDLKRCTNLIGIEGDAFNNNNLSSFVLPHYKDTKNAYWLSQGQQRLNDGEEASSMSSYYFREIWHTLQNDEVEIEDGVLKACSYDFAAKRIIIPELLDGQQVKCIAADFSSKAIVDITFPSTLENIGSYAFKNNYLTKVSFASCPHLRTIDDGAFLENKYPGIDSLDFSQNSELEYIGNSVFSYNSIVKLDLSPCKKLKSIGRSCFSYNSINKLDMSACVSLMQINDQAFYWNALLDVDLSSCEAMTYIGKSCFYNRLAKSLVLPIKKTSKQWTDYNANLYKGGDTLSNVFIHYSIDSTYTLSDRDVEVVNGTIVRNYYDCEIKHIVIPEHLDGQKVTGIDVSQDLANNEFSFSGKCIYSVKLPSPLQRLGSKTFYNNNISSLDFSQLKDLNCIGEWAFGSNDFNKINLKYCFKLDTIEKYAFENNIFSLFDLPMKADTTASIWSVSKNVKSDDRSSNYPVCTFTAYYRVKSPIARFYYKQLDSIAPLEIAFYGTTVNGVDAWHWSFGDGHISAEQNPIHSYSDEGVYDVELIASNAYGADTVILKDCIKIKESTDVVENVCCTPLLVYPNPTSGIIYIDSDHLCDVDVYDVSGKLYQENKMTKVVDISSMHKGLYILHIYSNENQYYKKIVKQ